jgi:outer membrane protein assembly factor BamD
MRNPRSRALSLALIAALALPIAGCARNRTRTDLPYVARDVGTLYTAAKNRSVSTPIRSGLAARS